MLEISGYYSWTWSRNGLESLNEIDFTKKKEKKSKYIYIYIYICIWEVGS
jgi:hypothetical protein